MANHINIVQVPSHNQVGTIIQVPNSSDAPRTLILQPLHVDGEGGSEQPIPERISVF